MADDQDYGTCPDCGTPRVSTGAPIWETYCTNEDCSYDKEEFVREGASVLMRRQRKGDWCQTASGGMFWPMDPDPDEIDINDIAHALSRQCRYGGHILTEWYSVAEHSYLLSTAVPKEYALSALLHDASEAFIQDIIRPVKKHLAGYLDIEEGIQRSIFMKYGVPYPIPGIVHEYDLRICADECDQIMAPPPMHWADGPPLGVEIQGWPPDIAKAMFLMRFNELHHE